MFVLIKAPLLEESGFPAEVVFLESEVLYW